MSPTRTPTGRADVPGTFGLGGAPLGNLYAAVSDDEALATIDAAWDAGVRYFDTAPHYGLGLSERRLGAALSNRPREQFAISTKVGRLLVANPHPVGSDLPAGGFAVPDELTRVRDYSRDGVRTSIEQSLHRLGLDRIDVAFVHDPEDHLDQAIDEAVPALLELRDEGVGAVGAGMNFVAPLTRLVSECDLDSIMVAGRWTLIDRSAEQLLDLCLQRAVRVFAAAPFNSGLLAADRPDVDGTFDYGAPAPAVLARARAAAQVCATAGVRLPHAAIAFPLRHRAVACVVAGTRSPAEARTAARWAHDPVPERLWNLIDTALAGTEHRSTA